MKRYTSWKRIATMNNENENSCSQKKDAGDFVTRDELNCNDVLAGRGGWVHQHPGNVKFRNLLRQYNQEYNNAERGDKVRIIHAVMEKIKSMFPPGRYLKEYTPVNGEDITECWFVMTHEEAVKKTRKAIKSIGKNSRIKTRQRRSPSSTSSSPCFLTNVVSSTSGENSTFISQTNMEIEQPFNSVAALPDPGPPEPFISSLSSSLHNHPSNSRRMEYYKLRHEESVLPPLLNRNFSPKSCRTYSDERKKLMMESSILSSSSIMSGKEGSTPGVAQRHRVSDNNINTPGFHPTPVTTYVNTYPPPPHFEAYRTPITAATTSMFRQQSNEFLPFPLLTNTNEQNYSRDLSPQNNDLDTQIATMGEEDANYDCDNPNIAML